jgi:hypothetical protein
MNPGNEAMPKMRVRSAVIRTNEIVSSPTDAPRAAASASKPSM